MAAPTKSKNQPSVNLTDLFEQEEALKQQLESLRLKKQELIRKQADEIREDVLGRLTEISKLISPLMDDEAWSWRQFAEFESVLNELELQPKEAKPVQANTEIHELVLEFVKTKPNGVGIDDIANGIKDSTGQPRWKVPSLRPQLPLLVKDGKLKVKPDPTNGRRNLYFVEK